MYSSTIVTDKGQLIDYKEIWRSLSLADSNANLFNSYEWVESWVQNYWIVEYKLNLVIIKYGEQPLGILPLYYNSTKKAFMLLGSGEPEICEVASEYLDFIIDTNLVHIDEIYQYVSEILRPLSKHSLEFVNTSGSSHVFLVSKKFALSIFPIVGSQYKISKSSDIAEITQGFSKNQKKKTRELLNRFNKEPGLAFQPITENNYNLNWETLRELHTKDWLSRGKPGAFKSEVFSNFHSYMHKQYPHVKQLYSFLSYDNEIISINHYYQYKDVLYFYTSGSNKDKGKRYSPGYLLHILCLSDLSGKLLVYDFLKGRNRGSYKEKICPPSGYFYNIKIYSNDITGTYKYLSQRLFIFIKSIKDKLQNIKKARNSES